MNETYRDVLLSFDRL